MSSKTNSDTTNQETTDNISSSNNPLNSNGGSQQQEGKGNSEIKVPVGSVTTHSGVISVMKRPSSWPNLLSEYWFHATNNTSLESPVKIASLQSPPLLTVPKVSTLPAHPTVDIIEVKRLHAGRCDDADGDDDEVESEEEDEDSRKCVVIIGSNFMKGMKMESEETNKQQRSRLQGDPNLFDEIRFLDEDTQSILLSPQLFSNSSILNPSLVGSRDNSPSDDGVNNRIGTVGMGHSKEPKPHFPIGDFDFLECQICLRKQWLYKRACCSFPACCDCLKAYFTTKIEQSTVTIECINTFCSSYVHRDEISTRLDHNMKSIYYRLLLSSNSNGLSKTCPQCNHVKTLDSSDQLKKMRKAAKKDPRAACVVCEQCSYLWCFPCCSPWHEGIKCKQYVQGDLLLHSWAKQMNQGQFNAQKCPKCKIFIQRSSGCDHMHCSRCKTDFCYRCGDQLRRLKFFGDHYSKLSVFGCKYRYKASQPVQRKLIRAAVFGSKVLLAPIIGSIAVAAGAMVLGVGVAALPLYGGIRFYRKYQSQKFNHNFNEVPQHSNGKSFMTSSKDVGVQTTVTTVTYFDENGTRVDVNILENINQDEDDIYEHGSIFDGRLFDFSEEDENGILEDSSSYEYNHGNNSSCQLRVFEEGDFQDIYPELPNSGDEGNYMHFYRSSNQTVSL